LAFQIFGSAPKGFAEALIFALSLPAVMIVPRKGSSQKVEVRRSGFQPGLLIDGYSR
jgi:hypothetical protein